jgi:hypothetical protein
MPAHAIGFTALLFVVCAPQAQASMLESKHPPPSGVEVRPEAKPPAQRKGPPFSRKPMARLPAAVRFGLSGSLSDCRPGDRTLFRRQA